MPDAVGKGQAERTADDYAQHGAADIAAPDTGAEGTRQAQSDQDSGEGYRHRSAAGGSKMASSGSRAPEVTLCIASGVMISEVALEQLGIRSPSGSFWHQMHSTTATLTLILVPVHAALRWRWIAGVARRMLTRRPRPSQ